ncbi:hypothetical protein [Pseudomonas putida]|uniref:hypothetical protein n=1 Tax=Pseudomonas putida TaxID=303 RepID=UPI0002F7F71C|nr:hypothetical protein [Pseudomonas putida]
MLKPDKSLKAYADTIIAADAPALFNTFNDAYQQYLELQLKVLQNIAALNSMVAQFKV